MRQAQRVILARACSVVSGLLGTVFLVAGLSGFRSVGTVHAAGADGTDAAKLQFYKASVEPVLRNNCYRCHSGMNRRGGLQMDTRQSLMQGGHDGPAVIPGRPEDSLLIKLIRHEGPKDDPMSMPPKGKLSDEDIVVVTKWVADGAVMDR